MSPNAVRRTALGFQGGQAIQRAQVVPHVAVGRVHDRRRSVEHMVAAQQEAILRNEETEVVRRVARLDMIAVLKTRA